MRNLIYVFALILVGCGGGGGTATTNTNTNTNPNTVTPTIAVTGTCTLKTYNSTYPNSFLGYNPLPTPTSKFDNTFMRGVGVKDYYPSDNNGCDTWQEHTRLLYSYTLDRLKAIGTETVEIYPAGRVTDFSAEEWIVEDKNWGLPKSELAYFIQEAHKRNMKVSLIWQFIPVDTKGVWLNTGNPTEKEAIKFLRGWRNIMIELAKFGEMNKADIVNLHWNAFSYPTHLYPETTTLAFVSLIDEVKKIYSGKLFMGVNPMFSDKRVIEKVDAIVLALFPSNWSAYDDVNISTSLVKDRVLDAIAGNYLNFSLYSGMDTKNIPVVWSISIQSRNNALSNIWVEDGFCVALGGNDGPIAYSDPRCIQKTYVTDFSVQSMAIEGTFQAIKQQTYFKNYGVMYNGYWHTDTINPGDEGFPNLSSSIRGKPSENLVKSWFSKG